MKYALMIRNDALSKETALKIKEGLKDFFMYDDQNPDLVISIGGDGTILERKNLLVNERDKLIEKQSLIHKSLEKLNYKIENYEKILNKEI